MFTFTRCVVASLSGILLMLTTNAQARDVIQIAGSSTLLPFSSIVAEEFGQTHLTFKTPVVASGGTGGGLRQFCQGVGTHTIDIANASRPIKSAEIERCQGQGVNQIIEVLVGYDGIVFASHIQQAAFSFMPEHIFMASAAQLYLDGQWVTNPYHNWSQIDASLPNQEISLVIPASNHGTREVFEEKILQPGCSLAIATAPANTLPNNVCTQLRSDGRIIEVAGDYTETLTRLQVQPHAIGVFGLNFYEQNRDRLQVAKINGVLPSLDSVASGTYPVSRPLYFYVKGEHLGLIPGLAEFVAYFLSDDVSGFDSPLEEAGLIPLDDEQRQTVLNDVSLALGMKP